MQLLLHPAKDSHFAFQTAVKPKKPLPSHVPEHSPGGQRQPQEPHSPVPLPSCAALGPPGTVLAAAQSKSAQYIAVLGYQPKRKGRIETLYLDTLFQHPFFPCGGCRMLSSVLVCPCPTTSTDQDPASNSQALAMMDEGLDKGSSHHPGDQIGTCWKTH